MAFDIVCRGNCIAARDSVARKQCYWIIIIILGWPLPCKRRNYADKNKQTINKYWPMRWCWKTNIANIVHGIEYQRRERERKRCDLQLLTTGIEQWTCRLSMVIEIAAYWLIVQFKRILSYYIGPLAATAHLGHWTIFDGKLFSQNLIENSSIAT